MIVLNKLDNLLLILMQKQQIKAIDAQLLNELKSYINENYPEGTTKINFGSNFHKPIGPEGISILIKQLKWNIEVLNVTMHKIENQGLRNIISNQLQQSPVLWTDMKCLIAIKNNISSEGLVGFDLLEWPQFQIFHFTNNKIDSHGIDILIRGNFKNLKNMFIGHNNIGLEGCRILSLSDWPKLERLDVNYNFVTNEGVRYLTYANWPYLKQINLSNNKLDALAMGFVRQANWQDLQIFHAVKNNIGMFGDEQLTDSGCFNLSKIKSRKIKNLALFGNNISLNGIRMIFSAKILVENCFLQLIKNLFSFQQIKPYLLQYNLFCNEFQN